MVRQPCALCNAVQIYTNVYHETLMSNGSVVLLMAILSLKPEACSRQAGERGVKRKKDPHALARSVLDLGIFADLGQEPRQRRNSLCHLQGNPFFYASRVPSWGHSSYGVADALRWGRS
jgi:hypothetical protein